MRSFPLALVGRIQERSAMVAIVGLGYVGLPLAVGFGRAGFRVLGVDLNDQRVAAVNAGRSYIPDVDGEVTAKLVAAGRLRATASYDNLAEVDVIFICVPTPFSKNKTPDLSFIQAAAKGISSRLRAGQLVILQSTTHPGTTEEDVLPVLELSGLRAGVDFHLAFCPERINPGDRLHTVENTPKVVGGLTERCGELAGALMATLGAPVHRVSSPKTAEMAKLLENTFRSVNIALVNELATLSERMGIDFWEVIDAASTKPFAFLPHYPSAGVGGHCIGVDPYYLSWKAREYDFYTRFIELAAEVNQSMAYHTALKVARALGSQGKVVAGSKILVLGVAFKKDIDDSRNSPAERVIELLLTEGAEIAYNDPYVPTFAVGGDAFCREQRAFRSIELTDETLAAADCVLIISGHSCYDYPRIVDCARLVVDTSNATRHVRPPDGKVFKLGRRD